MPNVAAAGEGGGGIGEGAGRAGPIELASVAVSNGPLNYVHADSSAHNDTLSQLVTRG
jgi:hypothetical protein